MRRTLSVGPQQAEISPSFVLRLISVRHTDAVLHHSAAVVLCSRIHFPLVSFSPPCISGGQAQPAHNVGRLRDYHPLSFVVSPGSYTAARIILYLEGTNLETTLTAVTGHWTVNLAAQASYLWLIPSSFPYHWPVYFRLDVTSRRSHLTEL